MRWLDPKFRGHRRSYLIQSLMALAVIFIMALFIDIFIQTAIIASLGASIFILFTIPHKKVSRGRYLFGGYTIGIITGELCSFLMHGETFYLESLILALAVGLAMFFMVITNMEHPPAAALAMGIAVEGADLMTLATIYICLIIVFSAKKVLERWLIDLM